MCKAGDIIIIDSYRSHEATIGRHSFIVLDDKEGVVKGLPFDFIALAMSSFKDNSQKERKMKYPGNFPISVDDVNITKGNGKSGYVKAEQFYYFNKDKVRYTIIGHVESEIFHLLLEFIEQLAKDGVKFDMITDNL